MDGLLETLTSLYIITLTNMFMNCVHIIIYTISSSPIPS